MVNLGTYAAVSTVAAVGAVYHAFRSREQFYPAMTYLATSKISLLLLLNMGLVLMCTGWQLMKLIFLGSLREVEVERLNEQSWREVMEILFAMTIFREEFNVSFVGMVAVLLFIKAFHWLAQKRLEYIETTPAVSLLSHARIVSFMLLLCMIDSVFLHAAVSHLLKTKRPSVALFFAFETVILATSTVSMLFKYGLYMGDMMMEGRWESKAVYIFYVELVRDLLHLSLYLVFFLVIFVNYGLPLHLVRELYETFRNFRARVTDFMRYKKVTSNMNERFPDATAEELGRSDATCIICREEMVAAKKLQCGHLFHVYCLRSWLERQQSCPTCRSPVLAPEGGPAARALHHAANPAQRLQQEESSEEGRGTPEAEHQASGPGSVIYSQHQTRMQAAAMAAAQYASSFAYPAMIPGYTNWYLAYVPFVPQQYMFSIPRPTISNHSPPSDAQDGLSFTENPTQGGESADSGPESIGQHFTNSRTPAMNPYSGQAATGTSPYMQCSGYNFYPFADLTRCSSILTRSLDQECASSIIPDLNVAQAASSNFLELQQLQVKHRIEILQNQLKWAITLQNQLAAFRPQVASDFDTLGATLFSASQQNLQNFDQSSIILDRKGKAPVVNKDFGDIASSSTSVQLKTSAENSSSLLVLPEPLSKEE